MFEDFISFVRDLYGTNDHIPLHEPRFIGNEKNYLLDTLDTTFVSSVGEYVNRFEQKISEYTGVKHAIATVNGTAALHISLKLAGVVEGVEVITQSLTFVAVSNAIHYCGGYPIYVDVDKSTMGLSHESLKNFLQENCEVRDDGYCWNKLTGRKIIACVVMHTFGFPSRIKDIKNCCDNFNLKLIEDSAESLGSFYNEKHTGWYGQVSSLSFNGNKIITTGGGGMILTNDENIAKKAKHITTTAKKEHKWNFDHDLVGFNYRLPNLNASLGLAQLECIEKFLDSKLKVAHAYIQWGKDNDTDFFEKFPDTKPNYWLNIIITKDKSERDLMLEETNKNDISTRPVWIPMHQLEINKRNAKSEMVNTEWLADRIVCVPSSSLKNEN